MKSKIYKNTILMFSAFFVMGFVVQEVGWKTISVDEMTKKIKEIENFYKSTKSYSIKLTHKTFKNHTTNIVEDKAAGFFIKDAKDNYQSFAMGIRTIQNEKIKVTIDSVNYQILINEPVKSFAREVKVSELKTLLKACSKVKQGTWNDLNKYRFEFSANPTYAAYEIWTGAKSEITKLVIFFSEEYPVNPDDENPVMTKPRAEILFSDYKTEIQPDYEKYFDESKYVFLQNGVYVANDKYKKFEVVDLRTKH